MPAQSRSGSASFEQYTPRISALYRLSGQANLYATVSRGTRPGGFNLASLDNPALPATYDAESLLNYELGLKGEAFGRRLTYSAAAFYLDYSDIQSETIYFPPGTTAGEAITFNAGSAENLGFELELSALLAERLTIHGGVGYQDATFGTFETVDIFGAPFDATGNRLPLSSKWTANLALEYRAPLGSRLEGFARSELSYRSDYFETPLNETTPDEFTDDFETVNLRLGLVRDRLTIVAFGENLSEKRQIRGSLGTTRALAGAMVTLVPRRYGVRISYDF